LNPSHPAYGAEIRRLQHSLGCSEAPQTPVSGVTESEEAKLREMQAELERSREELRMERWRMQVEREKEDRREKDEKFERMRERYEVGRREARMRFYSRLWGNNDIIFINHN
jgi:hypothetical protein